MTKDEIKNRISMALKATVLQQGFEIICKENVELKKRDEQLAKAKEIIKRFSEFVNDEVEFDPTHPQEYTDLWIELCEKCNYKWDLEMKPMETITCPNCKTVYNALIVVNDPENKEAVFAEVQKRELKSWSSRLKN